MQWRWAGLVHCVQTWNGPVSYIGVVCGIDVDVVSQYMVYMVYMVYMMYMVYNCVYYCMCIYIPRSSLLRQSVQSSALLVRFPCISLREGLKDRYIVWHRRI
jgi:hypothetical protein